MMSHEDLIAEVREMPLEKRLRESMRMIGDMCAHGRSPRMSIPVRTSDEDFFICQALRDAVGEIERLKGSPHGHQIGKCNTCDLLELSAAHEKVKKDRNAFDRKRKKAEAALRVIYTWASYDFAHDSHPMTLEPRKVMELIERSR